MVYLILKLIHVISVILFLGNITIGIFWKRYAEKKNDPKEIASAFQGIIKADRIFTMPGVIGILIGGIGAAVHGGLPMLSTGWILWSIILFVISGIVFMAKLVPLQKKIYALASSANFKIDEYHSLAKQWEVWGFIASLTPWIAVALMILKVPN
jgi:uncharacterized membrane protein